MSEPATIEVIKRFIAEVCAVDLGSIQPHSTLLAFGLDSVRVLDLLLALESEFSVELSESDPELATITTVGDLAALVDRRRAGSRGAGGRA